MPQRVKINRLTNANIYLDGGSLLGRVEEFQAPTITATTAEHKALGMIATVDYFTGIDKVEGSLKFTSYYGDVLKKFANFFQAIRVQVRGSIEEYQAGSKIAETPAVVFLTIKPKDFPLGNFVKGENVDLTMNYSCTYARMEVAGEVVMELDVESNIYKVNGADMLAAYRQNLGI